MIRRAFFVLVAALAISSLTLQAGSAPARAKLGMVITQSDIASQIGFEVIKNGGNAIDAAVATGICHGGHASDRRQHRRRRLHRLSAGHRRAGGVRLPRSRPVALVTGDVAEGRQVRLRDASQQPPGGGRARHGGGPAPGVEGSGLEAVEGAGRSRRSRWRATASRSRTASRDRSPACSTTSRSIPPRSRSSRRTASRTKPARSSSSPISRAR